MLIFKRKSAWVFQTIRLSLSRTSAILEHKWELGKKLKKRPRGQNGDRKFERLGNYFLIEEKIHTYMGSQPGQATTTATTRLRFPSSAHSAETRAQSQETDRLGSKPSITASDQDDHLLFCKVRMTTERDEDVEESIHVTHVKQLHHIESLYALVVLMYY